MDTADANSLFYLAALLLAVIGFAALVFIWVYTSEIARSNREILEELRAIRQGLHEASRIAFPSTEDLRGSK